MPSPPPPMIQLTLGQLKLMGGELILITPYWPDQCWFPEVIRMAVLPPRRFKPHKWLLTNATTGEAIPKVMESIKLTAWKLSYRVCRREGLSDEATRRVLARWRKSTQAGYRPAWNDWCAFRRKEGLPVLQVCVKDLAEFLNHQIMTKNHKSSTLEHAASAICSILEPLAERRASAAPVIKAILMGAFYDNPPSRRTCATWDVKKVLDMLKAWGPPDQLNLY